MVYHLSPVQTLTCTVISPFTIHSPVQSHHLYSYITCIVTPVHSDSLSYHQVGVFTLITVPLSSLADSWCWLGDRKQVL